MPTLQFTIYQKSNSDIALQDTSDWGGAAPSSFVRKIYLRKDDGTLYNPFPDATTEYVEWASDSLIDPLVIPVSRDYCFDIHMEVDTYKSENYLFLFTYFSEQFLMRRLSEVAANPFLAKSENFNRYYLSIAPEIENAKRAVSKGQHYLSQSALSRIAYLIDNPQLFV